MQSGQHVNQYLFCRPASVWTKYLPPGGKSLGEFSKEENLARALSCLDHLVSDALSHVPDCIKWVDYVVVSHSWLFILHMLLFGQVFGANQKPTDFQILCNPSSDGNRHS